MAHNQERSDRILIEERPYPSGLRHFLLYRPDICGGKGELSAFDLLGSRWADRKLALIARSNKPLAQNLALARLLIPCLNYHRSGRHILNEKWSAQDLEGATLAQDTHTQFAKDLGNEQAREAELVRTGKTSPIDPLDKLFWAAHTELPYLPARFDDPGMGAMAKALYEYLIPSGGGFENVSVKEFKRRLELCRRDGFRPLGLGVSPRRLMANFKRLLAVSVRWGSQLAGSVALDIIGSELSKNGRPPLTPDEEALVEFGYGACRELGDINIEFLRNGGEDESRLLDRYYAALVFPPTEGGRKEIRLGMKSIMHLLVGFREKRKEARSQEKREYRQRKVPVRKAPQGRRDTSTRDSESVVSFRSPGRIDAEWQQDRKAIDPVNSPGFQDELTMLVNLLNEGKLTLKPRDLERIMVLWKHKGDRAAAAKELGVSQQAFSRKLRRTSLPNIVRAQKLVNPQQ